MDTSTSSGQDAGRIPYKAALISSIVFYIVAIIAAVLRGFVRWHYGQLRLLDDLWVVFSVACMTVAFGLWMKYIQGTYIAEALIYDPFSVLGIPDLIQIAIDVQIFSTVYIILSVTGIFAIKFSFLFFFRHLIDRIHKLQVYWRCIAIYIAIVWVVSICISPLACPFFDARTVQCAQGPYFHRAFDISVVLIVFDVSSDFLIISIPIILIRQIKIPLKSKIYLGMTLCLSFIMMVVAILQGATITYMGIQAVDVVWELYFQFIELTLAVLVVSLTAFRTLFVARRSKNSQPPSRATPGKKQSGSSAKKVWKKLSYWSTPTHTKRSGWSGTTADIPMSNGPLPTMIQPETIDSSRNRPERPMMGNERSSSRKISGRKYSETGLNSHPTTDIGGSTLASHNEPEHYMSGTLSGPMLDMPMAVSVHSRDEEDVENQIPRRRVPGRSRSQESAARRISYFQRVIRSGMERATAMIIPSRSRSVSSRGRYSPEHDSDRRYVENGHDVSPASVSPDRARERSHESHYHHHSDRHSYPSFDGGEV